MKWGPSSGVLNPEPWPLQDHVDYWGELPFYQMDLWEHRSTFAGVFTASRITQAAFATASIPTHILCATKCMGSLIFDVGSQFG